MSDERPPIEIHYNEPLPSVEITHPCLRGLHQWAWLNDGAIECPACGKKL